MKKSYSQLGQRSLFCLLLCVVLVSLSVQGKLASQDQASNQPKPDSNAELVKLYVSVSDKNGDFISKLNYYDFDIFCDKVPQSVSYFAKKDEPVGIVFLVDMSGSMRDMQSLPSSYRPIGLERGWKGAHQKLIASIPTFIENSHQLNEYSVILFNEKSWLATGWTRSKQELEDTLNKVTATVPVGQTSLYDSLVVAIEQVKRSSYAKRAVILLTDGIDQTSKIERSKLNVILQENNVPVYSVSINPDLFSLKNRIYTYQKKNAELFFIDIALMTGGVSFFPLTQKDLALCLDKIANELRNQYVIGFKPSCTNKTDKSHRVKVRLSENPPLRQ